MEKQFTKEYVQMDTKHMKNHSATFLIVELGIIIKTRNFFLCISRWQELLNIYSAPDWRRLSSRHKAHVFLFFHPSSKLNITNLS